MSPGALAEQACKVEIDLCREPIGKQDQYAASFGGLNFLRFEPDDSVIVEPLLCPPEILGRLQDSLITFYTGSTRQASSVLVEQSQQAESDPPTQGLLQRMTKLAYSLREELNGGRIDALGEILDEGWHLKRQVHPGISSSAIDDWYQTGKREGALGGKLLGAGGGGFLTFFAPPERHRDIKRALSLRPIEMKLERSGSRVLLYHH